MAAQEFHILVALAERDQHGYGIMQDVAARTGGKLRLSPRCGAYERYVDLYRQVVRIRKGDADIGPKLHGLLVQAGLQSVHLNLVHPFHVDQEDKELSLSTLVNIADAVVAEGLAERAELERTIAELERFTQDPTTVLGLPRVFQAWGRRA